MTGIPAVQVFLGEETTIDGTATWVDITDALRLEFGVTVNRGSSYGGGAQPGTATLTLENTDGRFTVGNTSSALYPYVHLQSLVKLTRDGRPWFVGRIQSMPMSWPNGGDSIAVVTVTLADKLARYERIKLDTFAVEEIAVLGPVAYYPMVEASGSTHADNKMPTPWPLNLYTPGDGTVAFGSATGPVGDGRQTPQFTPGTTPAILLSESEAFDTTTTNALTWSVAFATTVGGILGRLSIGRVADRIFELQATTYLGVPGIRFETQYTNSGFYPASVLDGNQHVVTLVLGAPGAVHADCYIDGLLITATLVSPVSSVASLVANLEIGSAPALFTINPCVNFTGMISHVALWKRALTSAEVALVNTTLKGYTLTTQAAMLKVLGWRGQASTALIDAGVADNIPSVAIDSASFATVLGNISASEAGTLYVDGQDRLTWRNRRAALSPTITLTNDDIGTGTTYNCDLTRVQTLVTGSRQSGGSVIVQSADYAQIGEIAGSVTSITTNPDDALQHASWVANTGPRTPYIGSLVIDMATASSATYTAVASGGILTKVTLTGMPSQTPPSSTVLEVIGESETISATAWDVTWTTLPAGIGSGRDLLILDDATYGVLDSTHRLAY